MIRIITDKKRRKMNEVYNRLWNKYNYLQSAMKVTRESLDDIHNLLLKGAKKEAVLKFNDLRLASHHWDEPFDHRLDFIDPILLD